MPAVGVIVAVVMSVLVQCVRRGLSVERRTGSAKALPLRHVHLGIADGRLDRDLDRRRTGTRYASRPYQISTSRLTFDWAACDHVTPPPEMLATVALLIPTRAISASPVAGGNASVAVNAVPLVQFAVCCCAGAPIARVPSEIASPLGIAPSLAPVASNHDPTTARDPEQRARCARETCSASRHRRRQMRTTGRVVELTRNELMLSPSSTMRAAWAT